MNTTRPIRARHLWRRMLELLGLDRPRPARAAARPASLAPLLELEDRRLLTGSIIADHTSSAQASAAASLTWAHTVGAGSNRMLIVEVAINGNQSGVSEPGANLAGANLAGTDFAGADLAGANLAGANLQGANLAFADLSNADLQGTNLQGADLQGANLAGANVKGANLQSINFAGADLTGVDLTQANTKNDTFTGTPTPPASVASVTYGGVGLTLIGESNPVSGPQMRAEMWGLLAPAEGTANIVVTLSGTGTFVAGATDFFGVDQSAPLGTFVAATGTGGPTVTATAAANDLVIAAAASGGVSSASAGSGVSPLWALATGTTVADAWGASATAAGAGSTQVSWSTTGTGEGLYAAGAVALLPASTATTSASSTVVTSSINPAIYGQSLTLTATVSAVSPATGTPTGSVIFFDGATDLETVALNGGSATYTTASFAAGTHSITVSYAGDANFGSSTSSTFTETISPATLTVAANAESKIYGQNDPALTYTVSGLQGSDSASSVLTGALARAAGENVGSYAINQGTLASNSNYTIGFTSSNLTITPATLTVAANAESKVYGQSDPALTYTVSGLERGDTASAVLTGVLARAAGENVGSYAINPGTLASNSNYTIGFTGNNLTITQATLTVAANAESKVYGQSDPALTYSVSGLERGDTASVVLTGALARAAGENVGSYAINQGTLAANSNYTIGFTGNNLTITPATLTVAANAESKVYGQSDPALTYSVSGLERGDTASAVLTGALARTPGENVGSYAINQGTLASNSNYTLGFTGNNLTITPATLTVAANAESKVYGQSDPALTYSVSGLERGDTASAVLTGALARAAGENVGSYAINQGTLAASRNYTLGFTGSNLTITPATLTVAANAESKVYGQSDPALTYSVSGLERGDTASAVLTGALARVVGENVGSYAINQGTLAASSNYAIGFTGSNLTITPAALTVAANAESKIYGQSDPALTYTVSGLERGDTASAVLTGALARAAGDNVGSYAINQGTLAASSNYTLGFTGSNLTITPATLTVAANAESKVYGQSDPALTYSVSGLERGDTASAALTGALARAAGENVGTYAINQGTLAANSNYTLGFTGNNLTITPAALTVAANAESKVYGQSDPALTYSVSGLERGDTASAVLTGALARVVGENVGTYAINQGTLAASSNYTLGFTGSQLTITPAALTVAANAESKIYGKSDPPLTYTVSGLERGDTAGTVLAGALARAPGADVGSYAINQGTLAANGNYAIRFAGSLFTITPATLLVSANDLSKVVGQPNPQLTADITGFVNGDTAAIVTGNAVLATLATVNSPVGTYAIAIAQGSLAAPNYHLAFANGMLTVTPAGMPPPAPPAPATPAPPTASPPTPSVPTTLIGLLGPSGPTAAKSTAGQASTSAASAESPSASELKAALLLRPTQGSDLAMAGGSGGAMTMPVAPTNRTADALAPTPKAAWQDVGHIQVAISIPGDEDLRFEAVPLSTLAALGTSRTGAERADPVLDVLSDAGERIPWTDGAQESTALVGAGALAATGYVLLNSRLGLWLLSLLTSRPLWQQFDPMEVLYAWDEDSRNTDDDDETLTTMVDEW